MKLRFLLFFIFTTTIFNGCLFMSAEKKTIRFNNKDIVLPYKTLVLNLNPWPQDLINLSKMVDARIYKTFVKAVFGDYVDDDKIGEQNENSLFSKVWFEGNFAFAKIRDNLSFRSGRLVTPNDIEFSITRFFITGEKFIFTTSKNTMMPLVLSNIRGYDTAINSINKNWHNGIISGINIINSDTISFELNEKDVKFFQKINMGFFPLVNKDQFKGTNYFNFSEIPDGCGNFKIIKYDDSNDFYLLENMKPNSKNSPKYIAFVFAHDEIGDIKSVFKPEGRQSNFELFVSTNLYTAYGFTFNFKSILGADPRFRELFELAIDRKKIADSDKFKRFIPENQLISNFGDNYKYRIKYREQNKIKANFLLEQLKKEYPQFFKNKELIIPTRFLPYENPGEEDIFIEIRRQFLEIGLSIKIENEKFSDNFFNPKSLALNDISPVLIFPKILVKEFPMSNYNSFMYFNTNLNKNKFFSNSDENDYDLKNIYYDALRDRNKIKLFNEYFCDKYIFIVFLNELKNFFYNKDKIYSLGDQSDSFYINLSNIEMI